MQWGTNDMSVQGQFPDRGFAALAAAYSPTQVPAVFWFCWSDGMVTPFGVTDANGAPKAAYYSFQQFGADR